MRKIVCLVVAVLAVFALAACNFNEEEKNDLEWLNASYSQVATAKKITETTKIGSEKLTRYSLEKVYTLDGNSYNVTSTEKTLNELSADEPYTVVTDTSTANKAGDFVSGLDFKEANFDEYNLSETGLKGHVKEGRLGAVLGLTGLDAEDANLTVTVDNNRVTAVEISYLSSDENVSITIKFEY